MKPQEQKFMKEFNKLAREVENIFMTEANDVISDALDKKGNHYYKLILEIKDQLYLIMSKIIDYESEKANEDELNSKLNELYDLCETIIEEFDHKKITTEMIELVKVIIKPKMDDIYEISTIAKFSGFLKVHNIIKLEIKKLYDKMVYLFQRIENESLCDYNQLIAKAFDEIKLKVIEKNDEIQNYINDNDTEYKATDKKRLDKILDCSEMDKLLTQLGYKAVRQKGSHKIYNNGSKSVPVPQHNTLNKCLGYQIQKQIKVN